MNIFGIEIRRADRPTEIKADALTIDQVMARLEAAARTVSGVVVTPETCMQSPTVHAVVHAIARRISVTPVHVYRKTTSNGRTRKELQPNHPVNRLLARPNDWQTRAEYWQDAASWFVRYGRHHAFKARGQTGPVRRLLPLHPGCVTVHQDADWSLRFDVSQNGANRAGVGEYTQEQVHYVRGPARDGFTGDSPIMDVRESIALEIAAEKFGAAMFGNGALPLLVFKYAQGFQGFKTPEESRRFIEDFQAQFSGGRRHTALLPPKGIEVDKPVTVENDSQQYLETRRYQRTVIAGALGVPPHLVGDLERATFNNVEQQDSDFTLNVILPVAQAFEAAMERDLLTAEDRANGVVIRFNLDAVLRADFKSRQEGLRIMREQGVISADDWRERENMNPLPDGKGGDDYLRPMNFTVAGEAPLDPPADPAANPEPDLDD
jgi:HK97 family phage portal protein